jgi:hypothetical protein
MYSIITTQFLPEVRDVAAESVMYFSGFRLVAMAANENFVFVKEVMFSLR